MVGSSRSSVTVWREKLAQPVIMWPWRVLPLPSVVRWWGQLPTAAETAWQDGAGTSSGTLWLGDGKREVLRGAAQGPSPASASAETNLFISFYVLVELIARKV